jgi:hypothetical protein
VTIEKIIKRARKIGRIRDGLVLCDNCDTPASASISQAVGWTSCAPCTFGEADSFDETDLIHDPLDSFLGEIFGNYIHEYS